MNTEAITVHAAALWDRSGSSNGRNRSATDNGRPRTRSRPTPLAEKGSRNTRSKHKRRSIVVKQAVREREEERRHLRTNSGTRKRGGRRDHYALNIARRTSVCASRGSP
jgi:hypothetical protein